MKFHDCLRLLHAQRSEGLDTCGSQYKEICMNLHLCLMESAADRRSFGHLLEKKHSKNYAMTVMARARRFHSDAKDLQQMLRDEADRGV